MYIKDYHDKPSFAPKGKSPFGIFLGVELEVEVNRDMSADEKAGEVSRAMGTFAITKHDSSIAHGFEICSSPASLDYHQTAWDKFFKNDDLQDGLRAYGTKTCGIHVHISRAPLSSLQIGKIVVFIHNPDNHKFIQRVAQRESNKYNNYVDGRKLTDATPRNCVKFQRHTAVNLLNPATVEIRIFKSNLKRSAFMKNLEFCQALVDFTWPSRHSVSESRQWKFFTRFVKENRKYYPHLHAFLVDYKFIIPNRKPIVTEEKVMPKPEPAAKVPPVEENIFDKYGYDKYGSPKAPSKRSLRAQELLRAKKIVEGARPKTLSGATTARRAKKFVDNSPLFR